MNPTVLVISALIVSGGHGTSGAKSIPEPATLKSCSLFLNPWLLAKYDPNYDPGKDPSISPDPHGCDPHVENHDGCLPADKALPSDHAQNHYYGQKDARGGDGPDSPPP